MSLQKGFCAIFTQCEFGISFIIQRTNAIHIKPKHKNDLYETDLTAHAQAFPLNTEGKHVWAISITEAKLNNGSRHFSISQPPAARARFNCTTTKTDSGLFLLKRWQINCGVLWEEIRLLFRYQNQRVTWTQLIIRVSASCDQYSSNQTWTNTDDIIRAAEDGWTWIIQKQLECWGGGGGGGGEIKPICLGGGVRLPGQWEHRDIPLE